MGAIRALPDLLINQIAAGEVVERPAAALKELLENSLDAGAAQIDVDARRAAASSACASRTTAPASRATTCRSRVARHATSKIASLDRPRSVATLGFRGEALASIASVARLAIAVARERLAARVAHRLEGGHDRRRSRRPRSRAARR